MKIFSYIIDFRKPIFACKKSSRVSRFFKKLGGRRYYFLLAPGKSKKEIKFCFKAIIFVFYGKENNRFLTAFPPPPQNMTIFFKSRYNKMFCEITYKQLNKEVYILVKIIKKSGEEGVEPSIFGNITYKNFFVSASLHKKFLYLKTKLHTHL